MYLLMAIIDETSGLKRLGTWALYVYICVGLGTKHRNGNLGIGIVYFGAHTTIKEIYSFDYRKVIKIKDLWN